MRNFEILLRQVAAWCCVVPGTDLDEGSRDRVWKVIQDLAMSIRAYGTHTWACHDNFVNGAEYCTCGLDQLVEDLKVFYDPDDE